MEATWGDGGGDAVEQGGQTAARWMSAEWGDLIFYIFFYFWVRTAGRPSMSIIVFLFGCDSSYKNVQFRLAPRNV
jgi:hypothetical protein